MIISPPYLLPRNAAETDEAWINRCMPGGQPGDGAYPLSNAMQWHGGLHLTEPETNAPVRAIADGDVVFMRRPTVQPAGQLPVDHAQAYRGGWTDNGVIVLRHQTEIGEGANASAAFFSIYMHLREIETTVQLNRRIYRKASLGRAGQVYGESGRLHFEIVCDDTNLQRLVGRASGNLNTGANGRTDAVYGSMHFRLPAGTAVYGEQPMLNNPVAHRQPPRPAGAARNAPLPAPVAQQAVHTTEQDLFVGLRYASGEGAAGNRGDAYLSTYQPDGTRIGEPLEENDAEYNLYRDASAISNAYPANAHPAPSAVYELLRFGRVIGPDALNPATVPHWRRIRYPGGTGWVNLNAANVNQFSDADFPHWMGWSLVDDSADHDSRCDSATVKGWLDVNGDGKVAPAEALARMGVDTVAPKLARAICKFPTEWNAATFDQRLGWIKTSTVENPNPVDEVNFERLRAHVTALAFWPGGMGLPESHWHWNPRVFIGQFRRCGWLSVDELSRTLSSAPAAGRTRAEGLRVPMSKMLRKYAISDSRLRSAHFFAQVGHETGWWQYREELGNERYFRTMYEVISSPEAVEDYRSGLARRLGLIRNGETEQQYGERRPGVVAAKAATMANGAANAAAGGDAGDGSRFRGRGFLQITGRRNYTGYSNYRGQDFMSDPTPALLATNDFNACDASGFYWGRERTNSEADQGLADGNITRVGGIVNRGSATRIPLHDPERRAAFGAIWERLNDQT